MIYLAIILFVIINGLLLKHSFDIKINDNFDILFIIFAGVSGFWLFPISLYLCLRKLYLLINFKFRKDA